MINNKSLHINSAFMLRRIHDVCFLIPFRKNTITTEAIYLNSTATLIFEQCHLAKSIDELAGIIAKQFIDIDEKTAADQLKPYIESYIEQGLLKYEDY